MRIGLIMLGLVGAFGLWAEHPGYTWKEDVSRDATGKLYMGREIAHVMGHQGAGWLERPEREREEQPRTLMKLLSLKPGDVVADIGAGSGYHTRRMAAAVGPAGIVYAVDIQPEMLEILKSKLPAEGFDNVTTVLGKIDSAELPTGEVDLVMTVDVYHEFSHPYEMIQSMCDSLKLGGRMVFVEYRAEDDSVPIKWHHKMSDVQVRKEMEPHPLRWVETVSDQLPWQHFIVFEKIGAQAGSTATEQSG
jgi:ubiquinone/menaquinone biosynthesis C-methylase UbiE